MTENEILGKPATVTNASKISGECPPIRQTPHGSMEEPGRHSRSYLHDRVRTLG
jgi:hypothetical protein